MRFPPQILFQGSGALPSPALHSFQTHFYKSVKTVSGFPGGSMVKNPPSNAGNTRDTFDPWVQKIPWRRKWKPIPVLLPGKFRGQRSLVGYSKWGHKESDTTEHILATELIRLYQFCSSTVLNDLKFRTRICL